MSDSQKILSTIETIHQKVSHLRSIITSLADDNNLTKYDRECIRNSLSGLDGIEDSLQPVIKSFSDS